MPKSNTILNLAILSLISFSPAASASISTGCYTTPGQLVSQGAYQFQSNGYCQQICSKQNHTVYALHNGNECACGSQLPPSSDKVETTQCQTPCSGFPSETCGGRNSWTVITDAPNKLRRDEDDSVIVTAPDTPDPMVSAKVNPTMVETGIAMASTADDSVSKTSVPSVILTAPSMTAPQQHGSSATATSMVIAASNSAEASSAAASSSGVASPSASAGAAAVVGAGSGSMLGVGAMVVSVAVGMLY
ncbi:hypothetical protein BO71DRAFT_240122 [Aspergillus ellipticus CBS 707.79]|uniref:WSC domain-containing protein n=1 Tax=Aspergillus ellipticus CBS 707.79 TaxID=1448320 RepID=A0A319D9Q6_9EURO|nr:hypothetical protein BO71DRAFT_240122 [Aspergillus ellipticus CBS 707.79]